MASLCQDAFDYDESYEAFFKGLGGLRLEGKPMPRTHDEYVVQASPFLRAYVERFASEIPVSDSSEYAEEWRKEKISCIASLYAYEGWSRHEHLKRSPT